MIYHIVICSLLFFTQAYSLPSMQEIYSEYTFVIQFENNSETYISLIPAAAFYAKNMVHFSEYAACYQLAAWQEISSLWQDVRSPKDIGCLDVPFSKTKGDSLLIYYLSITAEHKQTVTYILKCDPTICIKKIQLVPNYLLLECSLDTYKVALNDTATDKVDELFSDIFGEDVEIARPVIIRTQTNSLWYLVEKYGSTILAYYCSYRKRFSKWWHGLHRYLEAKARERAKS